MLTKDESLEKEIELEYLKINERWLRIHHLISFGLVVLALILEIGLGYLMHVSGEIHTTIPIYMWRYFILPAGINIFLILISSLILHSKHVSQILRTYAISFCLVAICFVIFTIHGSFTSLFYIFSLPILLTAIYGYYRLSALVSLSSILALIGSELCIKWDSDASTVMEDGMRLGNFLISAVTLLFFSVVSLVIIYFEKKRNQAGLGKEMERYQLQKKLEVDELTGISNRMAFRNAMGEMEADKSGNNYSFAMIDLDNFKQLNDSLGHVAGDKCLISFGEIMRSNCREARPFRYGGDEFSVLFKNSSIEEVLEICEKLREEFNFLAETYSTAKPLSISIGIARYSGNMSPHDLIRNSDIALYRSKMKKNRITLYEDSFGEDDLRKTARHTRD